MRQFFAVLLSIVVSTSQVVWAQSQPAQQSAETTQLGKAVLAPVLQEDAKTKEVSSALITADQTPQDPNFLNILRKELQRLQEADAAQAKAEGVLLHTTKRFTPESISFFIAIGAVTYNSMWIKSHGDPLAMERHILSLKDPIANLSFYMFMIANGYYMDFRTKKMNARSAKDIVEMMERAQKMRSFNYQGMAIGSLASSLTADMGHTFVMCKDKWLAGKNDPESVMACDQAWQEWTLRGKFTQYFPQIISMWAAQGLVDFTHGALAGVVNQGEKTSFFKKILSNPWAVDKAYKFTGADVTVAIAEGTIGVRSIKIVSKLFQFAGFVTADHFIAAYINRPVNNLIRPLFVDFDVAALNKYWKSYDAIDWQQDSISSDSSSFCSQKWSSVNWIVGCSRKNTFESEILNYSKQMQQWREHLNADVETDLAGWLEMTRKQINQVEYAYKFYDSFTANLMETLYAGYQIQNKQAPPSIMNTKTNYPFRTLPLYGVSTGEYKLQNGGAIEDLYLLKPIEIQKRQLEHIAAVVKQIREMKITGEGSGFRTFTQILDKLSSSDLNVIASGLNDINVVLHDGSLNKNTNAYVASEVNSRNGLFSILKQLRDVLGKPQPVVYPLAGFTQAFAANAPYKSTADEADYSLWSLTKKYKFNKASDLMLYKLICGPQKSGFDTTMIQSINILMPQFDPPNLLKADANKGSFCSDMRSSANMFTSQVNGKPVADYLLANLNYGIIGDYTTSASNETFQKWWLENGREPARIMFQKYDEKFKNIVEIMQKNMFGYRDWKVTSPFTNFDDIWKDFVDGANKSRYLKKNLREQMFVELELYLQLLQRALTPEMRTATFKTDNYLEKVFAQSSSQSFKGLYGTTDKELAELHKLFREYNEMIGTLSATEFEKYIAKSKQIDDAINRVLVKAGYKKEGAPAPQSEDLTASTPSATGSENSDKTYEDVEVKNPTLRQRVILAAVQGIRQLESENRRFLRMRIVMKHGLDLDLKEFMADWNNAMKPASKPRTANPRNTGG